MAETFLIGMIIGYVLDLIFGDPLWLPHPICLIGKLISYLEKKLYRSVAEKNLFMRGALLWAVVFSASVIVPALILYGAYILDVYVENTSGVRIYLMLIITSYMSFQILASKSLCKSSMQVYEKIKIWEDAEKNGEISDSIKDEAREKVSMIVGRDTKDLGKRDVIKATIETVAENTSDGVIAPMIYMLVGGPILAFGYKAINTMDSMIGYKNERYIYFGRFAAKADDAANFIPARITAMLMIISSFALGLNFKNAVKIYFRDRKKHSSPNSGQSEAVCAGALDIQLAGPSYYFGKKYEKEYIGDKTKEVSSEDIKKANRLMYAAGILFEVSLILYMWFKLS